MTSQVHTTVHATNPAQDTDNPKPAFQWRHRLKECPQTSGRHHWIMHAACVLVNAGVPDDESYNIILSKLTRDPQSEEISNALFSARSTSFGSSKSSFQYRPLKTSKTEVLFDPQVLAKVAARLPDIDEKWLAERSAVNVTKCTPDKFLQSLYFEGEKVLVFNNVMNQGEIVWSHQGKHHFSEELEYLREDCDEGVWFLCNPCDGIFRNVDRSKKPTNPTGRTRRSEENITSFRYALLESDVADPAQWLSAVAQLPLPIASIVTSGGRSFHALIGVNAHSKDQWHSIVKETLAGPLTILGADKAPLRVPVQLSRLPGCYRYYDGKGNLYKPKRLQKLLYLNPNPDCTPIYKL